MAPRCSRRRVVSALPWHVLRGLLPAESKLAQACGQIHDAPIVSLHLWLERPILDEPFIGLLDSPVHWVFSRDHIHGPNPEGAGGPCHHGGGQRRARSGRQNRTGTGRADDEGARAIPAGNGWREGVAPDGLQGAERDVRGDAGRPNRCVPMRRRSGQTFGLAGDWTNTGLPATIEGAVVSGQRAARTVDEA